MDVVAWEKHKKANALPGAGVFHTAEQLTPHLPNCAELSLRARFFTVIPGWSRGSTVGPRHDPPTLVRLALPRPPNLEEQYCPVRGACQEKIAKSR